MSPKSPAMTPATAIATLPPVVAEQARAGLTKNLRCQFTATSWEFCRDEKSRPWVGRVRTAMEAYAQKGDRGDAGGGGSLRPWLGVLVVFAFISVVTLIGIEVTGFSGGQWTDPTKTFSVTWPQGSGPIDRESSRNVVYSVEVENRTDLDHGYPFTYRVQMATYRTDVQAKEALAVLMARYDEVLGYQLLPLTEGCAEGFRQAGISGKEEGAVLRAGRRVFQLYAGSPSRAKGAPDPTGFIQSFKVLRCT